MSAAKTAVAAPEREHRCRFKRRNNEMCVNPALDQSDDALIYICIRHTTKVLAMVREHQERPAVGIVNTTKENQ
ncbi:hypothetical protein AB0F17_16160 [Nonomuraea sp. NPDC026600]|uniref:hypothetical protein n=1 Tax=Nonomuraea sp. NPDC026600 TaxID=3155363 RepID=UPI0033EFBCEC